MLYQGSHLKIPNCRTFRVELQAFVLTGVCMDWSMYRGGMGSAVVSTITAQQEGSGFDPGT